jgi:mRNA interferase MazF
MATRQRSESKKAEEIGHPRRGDIYLVSFDPAVGSEIQKTRPALVLQNDIGNRYSPLTIVAAISSKFDVPPYPTEVIMNPANSGLPQTSAVVLNQIRSVDKKRLIKRLGRATPGVMAEVNRALEISLGLLDLG